MFGAWSFAPQFGKLTVVVDDDIDIRDPNLVNWALAFRMQPEKDAFIMPGTAAVQLVPQVIPGTERTMVTGSMTASVGSGAAGWVGSTPS